MLGVGLLPAIRTTKTSRLLKHYVDGVLVSTDLTDMRADFTIEAWMRGPRSDEFRITKGVAGGA